MKSRKFCGFFLLCICIIVESRKVGRPKSEERSWKTEVRRPKAEPQLIPLLRSLSRFSSGRVRGV
ncbi:MAG: hypothetical protein PHW92_12720 [Lutibacter sp.]|nr:hypothetical protein [Lutibacter sp.]